MTKKALDMIDEKIVELLQENARIAIKEIAAQVFLSSPAVTARIERLESKGIIKGYHAAVDSVNLGYKIKPLSIWIWSLYKRKSFIRLLRAWRMS